MKQISNYSSPPVIPPVEGNQPRPLWSVMIPAYNCYNTLSETIYSVLMQAPGLDEMQIQVVDDGSTDGDVKALVERLGKGRVEYFRKEKNEGSLAAFETCLKRSRGELIHILHGDDKVRDGYYAKIGELFRKYPHVGGAFCRYRTVDEEGKVLWDHGREMPEDGLLHDWLLKIASRQRLQYCTMTVKREVYEKLGGFYGVTYGEDWEMWVRMAVHYEVAYTPDILAEYRLHQNSISNKSYHNIKHIDDMRWVINTIQKWIPDHLKHELKKEASRFYAEYAMDIANQVWNQTGNKQVTHKLMMKTAGLHTNKAILYKMMKIYTKMLINRR